MSICDALLCLATKFMSPFQWYSRSCFIWHTILIIYSHNFQMKNIEKVARESFCVLYVVLNPIRANNAPLLSVNICTNNCFSSIHSSAINWEWWISFWLSQCQNICEMTQAHKGANNPCGYTVGHVTHMSMCWPLHHKEKRYSHGFYKSNFLCATHAWTFCLAW